MRQERVHGLGGDLASAGSLLRRTPGHVRGPLHDLQKHVTIIIEQYRALLS